MKVSVVVINVSIVMTVEMVMTVSVVIKEQWSEEQVAGEIRLIGSSNSVCICICIHRVMVLFTHRPTNYSGKHLPF